MHIDVSPLVLIQCVHGNGNYKQGKAVVMFKMVAVEMIDIVWWNESVAEFCTLN